MIGFGRYNLVLKLGQGGMGAVYLARQKTLRRFCAIKVITPQYSKDTESAERFLREARSTASLSHPNLVSVFDCDQHDSQFFIAMEYVEGLTLGQILRQSGALPLPLALHFLRQAAAGLEYIHEKSIVHRDIKPDNMIVDAGGILKIMDLGLAKDRFEGDQSMTITGTVMGSPQYMSPEQINDSKTVDHRTDLYSLGISFYQMIAGKVPYQESTAAAVCISHLQKAMPSVGGENPELTQALDGLIANLTAKAKEERCQSAGELIAALDPWNQTYPLDEAASQFFASVNFEERKIDQLLATNNINTSELDSDLDAPPPAVAPPSNVPPPTISPPGAPLPSSLTPTKWLFPSAAAACLILAFFGFVFLRKAASKKTPVPMQQAAQTTPPPKPVPPPVSQPKPKTDPEPPPVKTPPSPVAPLPPKTGGMIIKTQPDEAQVVWQTRFMPSPAVFSEIPPGKHKVKILKSGYREMEKEVEVKSGEMTEIILSLARIPGSFTITTDPPGASLYANGKLLGPTPCKVEGYEGDDVSCLLKMEGFNEHNTHVELRETGGGQHIIMQKIPQPPQPFQQQAGIPQNQTGQQSGVQFQQGNTGGFPGQNQQAQTRFNANSDQMDQPGSPREGFRKMLEFLELARKTESSKWGKQRDAIKDQIEEHLKFRNPNPRDSSLIRKAVSDTLRVLDEARVLSSSQYEKQKTDLARKMVQAVMKAVNPGGQPGGFRH
ncbi:MAG: serine/threonine protein kinase [Verrucomicrobiae bacterium]|nr:serine/threonine protein kinase [Verrucomicrobiae bacterium]